MRGGEEIRTKGDSVRGWAGAKVHAGELDELVEQLADGLAPGAADEGQPECVDGVHEDAVLIVHGAHAHAAGVVPGEKGHMSLHK